MNQDASNTAGPYLAGETSLDMHAASPQADTRFGSTDPAAFDVDQENHDAEHGEFVTVAQRMAGHGEERPTATHSSPCGDDAALVAMIAECTLSHNGGDGICRLIGGIGDVSSTVDAALRALRSDLVAQAEHGVVLDRFVTDVHTLEPAQATLDRLVPVFAALTARCIAQGLSGSTRDRDAGLRLAGGAVAATRRMIAGQGAGGLMVLPALARVLLRTAERRHTTAAELGEALPRFAARLSREPELARRLMRAGAVRVASPTPSRRRRPDPRRRLVMRGPVEIMILSR